MGVESSLRIGFLDSNKTNMLDSYSETFDIVLIGEGNFDIGTYILLKILKMDVANY